jgi:hypothetical protein
VTIVPVPGAPAAIDPASTSTSTAATGPTGTLPATGGGPAPWWAAAALLLGLPLLRRTLGLSR